MEPDLNEDSLSLGMHASTQPSMQETVKLFLAIIGVFILVAFIYFLTEHAYSKGTKSKKKKIFLSVFLAAILVIAAVILAWTFSYHWSFSVITNKPSYELGEDVYITVVLENVGYVPLSFKSVATNPVVVNILDVRERSVGFFPTNHNYSGIQFTIPPHQSLERTFVWNQAHRDSGEQAEPGKYIILAYIYGESWNLGLFQTCLAVNITSN